MTIQMRFEIEAGRIKTYTYRKVYRGVNLAQYRESFLANRDSYKSGVLVQLKGKDRILLNSFGLLPQELQNWLADRSGSL